MNSKNCTFGYIVAVHCAIWLFMAVTNCIAQAVIPDQYIKKDPVAKNVKKTSPAYNNQNSNEVQPDNSVTKSIVGTWSAEWEKPHPERGKVKNNFTFVIYVDGAGNVMFTETANLSLTSADDKFKCNGSRSWSGVCEGDVQVSGNRLTFAGRKCSGPDTQCYSIAIFNMTYSDNSLFTEGGIKFFRK